MNERISFIASNRCLEIIQQTERYWYVEEFHLLIRMKCFNQAEIRVESCKNDENIIWWYWVLIATFQERVNCLHLMSLLITARACKHLADSGFYSSKSHFVVLSFSFPFMIDWHYKYNTQLYASNLNYFYIISVPGGRRDCSVEIPVEFAFRYDISFDEPCGDIILHVNTEMKRFLVSFDGKIIIRDSTDQRERCKTDPSLISI